MKNPKSERVKISLIMWGTYFDLVNDCKAENPDIVFSEKFICQSVASHFEISYLGLVTYRILINNLEIFGYGNALASSLDLSLNGDSY